MKKDNILLIVAFLCLALLVGIFAITLRTSLLLG